MSHTERGERAPLTVATIDCYGLEAPLEVPFGFSQAWVRRRRAVLVRVETRDGIEGWGEIYCQVPPPILVTLVAELLAPLLIGTDPWDREVTWQRVYNATLDAGQAGLIVGALSGLDVALWDIVAKDAGQPVARLLGGAARPSIRAYATGLYRLPGEDWFEAMAEEARQYVDEGYGTLKMKVGFGLEIDAAAVRAVRAAIGPAIALGIDANHAYRAREAVALGRRLADQQIAWFEEPVSPQDLDGYRQVRREQPIPVSGGEIASTRFGFRQLIDADAVEILQPDLGWAGGLSEGKAIAALARGPSPRLLGARLGHAGCPSDGAPFPRLATGDDGPRRCLVPAARMGPDAEPAARRVVARSAARPPGRGRRAASGRAGRRDRP